MINTSEDVRAKDPSEMTEEENKARLDEIKRKMKALKKANIVKESWGGDRSSASVTATVNIVPSGTIRSSKFSDATPVTVTTSQSTNKKSRF